MADLTPGEKRWTVLYGEYRGVEKQALLEVYRGLQYIVNYVLPLREARAVAPSTLEHVLLIGTPQTNPRIADLIAREVIPAPSQAESYVLWIGAAPWHAEHRLIVIAGADAPGTLHGAAELRATLSAHAIPLDKPVQRRAALTNLPDRSTVETPAVRDRGLWTWGYVMYDYRQFLDNMVRLKLNMLTIWNSEVPLNIDDITAYAHERGIRIIAGFNWGWGYANLDIGRAEDRATIKKLALATYREEYADTAVDGIYFQTLTEHKNEFIAERSVASLCCDMVNDIAREFYDEKPELSIQFGLHASSIRTHYTDLAELDPRLIITWEDAGALPYSYSPDPDAGDGYEATLAYSKQLAAFRPRTPFALVPKGWMCLRWDDEFAKHGPFLLGERDRAFLGERLHGRQGEWNWTNMNWFRSYPLAARFYREVCAVNPHVIATALLEDGMFDARIQPSVSLFAETVWNPHQDEKELLARALRPYVTAETF